MLPQVVERTMKKLCDSLSVKNFNIAAVYIYGSVALGDYIEGSSDIDFIAILREPLNISDIQAISAAHREVENVFPQADIMGAYLLDNDLGKPQSEISPLITYYNKHVHSNGYGADINPITWWTLKNHGIKVFGSEQSLNYEVEIKSLLGYVIDNLNNYWVTWIERLEKQLLLSDQERFTKQLDESVEWCTLGMLRQLYTIKEHNIKSKVEAGYYGITTVPQHWHRLIYEAINIKRLRPERYYCSNEKRLTDLVALLRYIHLEANRVFDDSNGLLNK
ncbi:nucleotidyltransferase domain-containing protein [Paenibacillus sp. HW567]|uniref:nucleotidyltransferase domain-containing protein n=1 Tax=Paenibacillus sp. HW567 TaxID=1034769 RepID=UPI00035C100B|nr:nucleotidyltransferase domain-containing protein [Paenibacillus sp. HW567]